MAAEISLAAEPIHHIGAFTVTNSMLTAVIISVVFIVLALVLRMRLSTIPSSGQSILEMVYDGVISITERVTGNRHVAKDLFPFVVTAFFFIVFSNWSGIMPGVGSILIEGYHHGKPALVPLFRAPTADLNTVIALALCSVIYVQYLAMKYRGVRDYFSTFFNFNSPIYFFVGIIEFVSEWTRVISYSFRLFGNVFAGEVLIATIVLLTATLAPILPFLPLPFYFLEIFVGLVQALVFCFLTIVFAGIATAAHGEHAQLASTAAKQAVTH
jgi:F-type H+-transporting ATPase subunit a